MQFALKLIIANGTILLCVWLGKRFPALAGLIATMPITTLIVLLWLHHDNPQGREQLGTYVGGVFFGVIPTMLFFGTAWLCLKAGCPLPATLLAGFVVWLAAATVHQLILR